MLKRYENEIPGFNNRMTEISAAIGLIQLKKLGNWTTKRRSNAAFFDEHLEGVVLPKVHSLATHSYHQYTIRTEGHVRSRFALELSKLGVQSDVYYPTPVHRLAAFGQKLDLEVSEAVAANCLSIPVHQSLSRSDLSKVVESVNKVASAGV